MQLRGLAFALLALLATPAAASCDIGVSTPGILAPTGTGAVLSSEAGIASVVAISNLTGILNSTVTISNPRLDSYPAGFAAGSATVEENYSAIWLLGASSNPAFTAGPRSFVVPLGLLITITINNRVTAPGGLKQGSYTTKTSIDCT